MNMQRRGFLKTLAATGAAGAIAGCATTGSGPSMGKVVVVGGGYGGATAAKYIRMWSDGRIDVTLVEPNAAFVSCPTSNLVLGGSKTIADITVPYDGLARNHGVRVPGKPGGDLLVTLDVRMPPAGNQKLLDILQELQASVDPRAGQGF